MQQRRDIAVMGFALEKGGAAAGTGMGPAALRTAGLVPALARLGHRVEDRGTLHEADPVPVAMDLADGQRCRHIAEIAGWVRLIHDAAHDAAAEGTVPLFLGGDHSISMGSITGVARAAAAAGRELAVLWIDAHADFNTPATSPSGNLHGMVLSLVTGDPSLAPVLGDRPLHPVPPARVCVFGARSIDPEERDRIRALGLDCVDMRRIDEDGVSRLLAERLARWRAEGVSLHVSLDVDFLDPAVAPGSGTVVPGGATYREAHLVMEMLAESGLVGSVDVVELNPFLDERGRSAFVMTELVESLFGRTVLDRKPVVPIP